MKSNYLKIGKGTIQFVEKIRSDNNISEKNSLCCRFSAGETVRKLG